jgi:hypothetical protein
MPTTTMLLTGVATITLLVAACSRESAHAPATVKKAASEFRLAPVSIARAADSAVLTPGTYTVCDEGSHADHNHLTFWHLKWGQQVVINELKDVTHVKIGDYERDLNKLDDGAELAGLSDFPHSDKGKRTLKHLVRIRRENNYQAPAVPDSAKKPCDISRTIIAVQFCLEEKKGNSNNWLCVGPDGTHFGDTHAQN